MWFVIDSLARVVNFSGVESHEDEVSNMNLQAKLTPTETVIHGKVYELSKFEHPGGIIALDHIKQRDGTIFYQNYHQLLDMKRVDAVRDRYFVRDVPSYVEEFDWNTPFQLDLVRAMREYFSTLGKKSEIRKNIKVSWQWTFITFCLLSARVYFWYLLLFKRLWIAVLLSAVTDYLCAVNIFHAACHFAFSSVPWINHIVSYTCTSLSNPYLWIHQHNISHHARPNELFYDVDVHHGDMMGLNTHPEFHTKESRLGWKFSFLVAWSFQFFLLNVKEPLRVLFSYPNHRLYKCIEQMGKPATGYFLGILIDCSIYWGLSWAPLYLFENKAKGLAFVLLPKMIHSVLFMLFSQISHIQMENFKPGERDWFKLQIQSTTNYGVADWFSFFISGGLSHQIEHHVAPSVHHCHYPHLRPIFQEVCKKHDVAYKEFNTISGAFFHYWEHMTSINERNHDKRD